MQSQPIAAGHPWLTGPHFNLREVCALLNINPDTVTTWLAISKAMGALIPTVERNRRRLTAHQAYAVAVLAALAKSNIPISESIIRRAIAVTHDADGKPAFPVEGDVAQFAGASDDQPAAKIYLDLWAVWRGLSPKLAELFESEET